MLIFTSASVRVLMKSMEVNWADSSDRRNTDCVHSWQQLVKLGGFKRSSQHSEVGGCDEHSKAAIGTVWTSAI
ncbi:hypothetical protein NKI51_30935, partial [Mesorhizobium australicum]|uniref:hypothetical protein n=1 Tax=Mesorhizobium australicum TaxID=536018 RepID=UPI003339DB80